MLPSKVSKKCTTHSSRHEPEVLPAPSVLLSSYGQWRAVPGHLSRKKAILTQIYSAVGRLKATLLTAGVSCTQPIRSPSIDSPISAFKMDVNLTISLMRGQMGAVIEKAVNVAVETVLGEMIRVVGLKFEEIKREMTVKEKENENIRKMLDTSRSQMKTMRKYITLLSSKDQNRVYQGDGAVTLPGVMCRKGPTSTLSTCTKPPNPCSRPRIIEPAPVSGPSWVRQQMHMPKAPNVVHEPIRSENFHTEEIHGSSGHKGMKHPRLSINIWVLPVVHFIVSSITFSGHSGNVLNFTERNLQKSNKIIESKNFIERDMSCTM